MSETAVEIIGRMARQYFGTAYHTLEVYDWESFAADVVAEIESVGGFRIVPAATAEQREAITKAAQAVLDNAIPDLDTNGYSHSVQTFALRELKDALAGTGELG